MKVVKSLDDITLPEEGTIEIPREGGPLRIPIRPIPMSDHQQMMKDFKPPAAPQKFDKLGKMTADGKPGFYFDENDPVHQGIVTERSEGLMKAMVLKGMALNIPGTPDEQYEALSKKLTAGDFSIILEGINALSNITSEKADEVKNS